jgi:hypothetical protein
VPSRRSEWVGHVFRQVLRDRFILINTWGRSSVGRAPALQLDKPKRLCIYMFPQVGDERCGRNYALSFEGPELPLTFGPPHGVPHARPQAGWGAAEVRSTARVYARKATEAR